MTRILAIDLGKFKSVCCDYDTKTQEHTFTTIPTTPAAVHDLIVERLPESGAASGAASAGGATSGGAGGW